LVTGRGRPEALTSKDAFGADDLAVAHILARNASVAIATARQEETPAQAIDARQLPARTSGTS
jgi:GAF domain-containing protein